MGNSQSRRNDDKVKESIGIDGKAAYLVFYELDERGIKPRLRPPKRIATQYSEPTDSDSITKIAVRVCHPDFQS